MVEKIKLASFEDKEIKSIINNEDIHDASSYEYQKKIDGVKNEKIRKSLIELSKFFKKK